MNRVAVFLLVLLWPLGGPCLAFIEAPHSVGRICNESTNIMVVELVRVDAGKNLLIYRKVRDLKGRHPQEQIRHNIGQRGSNSREWKNVMAWAAVGKQAVFFHNGNASLTCIDDYWYQCFKEGEWWAMSHAEPFLLRTYCGSAQFMVNAVPEILAGKEVVVPAMHDGPPELYHERKGKMRRIRASLKLLDYDAKRDFVADGRGEDPPPAKAGHSGSAVAAALPAGASLYRAININGPALTINGQRWEASTATGVSVSGQHFENQKVTLSPATDAERARMIRSCVWGAGASIVLRDVPAGNYLVFAYVWEDNQSQTFDLILNGRKVVTGHDSGAAGHWARLGPWTVQVSDGRIALANASKTDANLSGLEVYRVADESRSSALVEAATPDRAPGKPADVQVDAARRRVILPCTIAPRKLAHLNDVYPVEVVATYPSPFGQKAHETIVTFEGVRPSELHAALEKVGLKPGRPARGEKGTAEGPSLRIRLEVPGPDGKALRIPIEQALVDRKTGKAPAPLRWRFTGSARRQPDPEKDQRIYGADMTGTLIAVFPVTDDTVIQSELGMGEESGLKLETNRSVLPKEGTAVKLLIDAGQ